MTRSLIALVGGAILLSAVLTARQAPVTQAGSLVELDVSVTDKTGIITDLKQEDFQIQDDGKRVEIASFKSVLARGTTAPGDGRELVLVMDDAGVPMAGTQAMQQIANLFVSAARPGDHVSVMRLHTPSDEVSRDRQVALARIAAFQAGSIPFFQNETTEDLLRLVIRLSKEWEPLSGRRKAIVCIGSPAVCTPIERESTAPRDLYPNWVNSMSATARANVVVYAAIPGRFTLAGGSLIDSTGGEAFGGISNFVPAVEQIYGSLSQYYLLGYVPQPSKKDLRNLSVRVNRRGVTVHARTRRGNS